MSTFQIYGKRLVENYLIKLYESKTKKNLNERCELVTVR